MLSAVDRGHVMSRGGEVGNEPSRDILITLSRFHHHAATHDATPHHLARLLLAVVRSRSRTARCASHTLHITVFHHASSWHVVTSAISSVSSRSMIARFFCSSAARCCATLSSARLRRALGNAEGPDNGQNGRPTCSARERRRAPWGGGARNGQITVR